MGGIGVVSLIANRGKELACVRAVLLEIVVDCCIESEEIFFEEMV